MWLWDKKTRFENLLKTLSKLIDVFFFQFKKVRVDTSNAGEGALSVSIRAAGQEVRHTIQDLANGQYDVLFYPTMAIVHKLDIKYNGLPITSNPIETKVRNPGKLDLLKHKFLESYAYLLICESI